MRSAAWAALLAAGLVWGTPAFADDTAQARQAYERATRASKAGDYARAAEEFARADALSPSPNALEAALDAAVQADQPELGAELLKRSKRAPASGSLAESVAAAHAKFDGRGGHVRIVCAKPPCKVEIDNKPVDPDRPVWITKGAHAVVREDASGTKTSFVADVKPDTLNELDAPASAPAPAPSPPAPPDDGGRGLPPVVFYAAAGLTVVAGVVTIGFGLDANGTHDDFEKAGCARGAAPTSQCVSIRDDGEGAETRSNIALVSTISLAVVAGVVGVFFTDWRGGKSKSQAWMHHRFGLPMLRF